MLDSYFPLLVKLAAMASIASLLARSNSFKSMLMRETRTLHQRAALSFWLSSAFGAGVAIRVFTGDYPAADLGLEGSLLAGILGGYVTGLCSGVLISVPAMFGHEHLTMPLLAGVGVLGGLLRDFAPDSEEIWRFSPAPDLSIYRFFRERDYRTTSFHLVFIAVVLVAEFLRTTMGELFNSRKEVFYLQPAGPHPQVPMVIAIYATTLFAVAIPLKIWNNTRNEKKLEEQARLLVEARLAALTSQINPHFLFNTLNSVSSLIRTDPNQARVMVVRLSKVLRRLLRKHENFSTLRDELSFIEDYLAIEVVRFGDKLRFEKDVAEDTLDMLVPSMLLQPLVENSIKHGLSSKVEGGIIRIRTSRAGPRLHLLVEDDGVGIPETKLATLLHQGIGVSNVHERLQVLFGNEYRMWIDSQPGNGTRIQIELPELQSALAAVS
ncbi:MAG TPA: sensor histidine kinase [Candidatus Acidoferrales bacterium]|nr:sensor histidine kinase [Candidatus Acidoferrales bacterium]